MPTVFEMLVNATRLLASDADVQMGVFPDFVCIPDELALNFADSYLMADQLVESGDLTPQQLVTLNDVEKLLTEMTNRGEPWLWTLEALRESAEWQKVRSEARRALDALGVGPGPPSIAGITYIKSGPE